MSTETIAQQPTQGVRKFEEKTVDAVLSRINDYLETGDIVLPPNYIPENAVRAAWLHLQDVKDKNNSRALDVCTKESIANAFLEMVIKGLSVVKKQAYFVVYGNELSLDESYFGAITIAKRDAGVKEPVANMIYKGDVFKYKVDLTTGRKQVTQHDQLFENIIPENIIGAYSIVTFNDGSFDTEIMTMAQIRLAWSMGGAKGDSPAHKKFPDQMAAKTVISRSLKVRSSSSDDSALMRDEDQTQAGVRLEIKEKGNKKPMSFDDAVIVDTKKQIPVETKPEQSTVAAQPVQQPAAAEPAF